MRGTPVTYIQKKQTIVRVPFELLEVIEKRARQRYSSVNQELLTLAKIGLANEKPEAQALEEADQFIAQEKEKERAELFALIEEIQTDGKDLDPDEVMQDVLKAQQAVRATLQ